MGTTPFDRIHPLASVVAHWQSPYQSKGQDPPGYAYRTRPRPALLQLARWFRGFDRLHPCVFRSS